MTLPLILFHNQGRGSPVGGGGLSAYEKKVLGYSPIAYWPLKEKAGSVARDVSGNAFHGAYVAATLGQTGIGDGNTCPLFDGSTSYVDSYSAALNTAMNKNKGTLVFWAKVSASGIWSDSAIRIGVNFGGTDERIYIGRTAANGVLQWYRRGGGTTKAVTIGGYSDTGWMHLAITWDTTADELKAYFDGVQKGSTQTSNAAWVSALSENLTNIGSQSETPAEPWSGNIAHVALWTTALSVAQILALVTV